jgi:hypothetical protein
MNPGSKFRASAPYFVEGSRNSNREATQLHESIPYEEDHLTVNKLASDDYVTQNSGYFSVKSKISDYELQNRTNNHVKLSDYLHIDKNKKFQTIFDFFVEFRQFKFVDDIFQSNSGSLLNNKLKSERKDWTGLKWMRLSEIYKNYDPCLFNEEYDDRDLIPGCFEDTYLPYALSCLGVSGRVKDLFPYEQLYNVYGVYMIQLNDDGVLKQVVIDDYVPCVQVQGDLYEPVFSKGRPVGKKIELWPILVVKALAKHLGSYENLLNGSVFDLMRLTTEFTPIELPFIRSRVADVVADHLDQGNLVFLKRKPKSDSLKELVDADASMALSVSGNSINLKNLVSFDDLTDSKLEKLTKIQGQYVNSNSLSGNELIDNFNRVLVMVNPANRFNETYELYHLPGGFSALELELEVIYSFIC